MADTRQVVSWALERKCPFRSGEGWFLPDRTATQLGALGISGKIIDAILNHKDGSVGAIYNRYAYAKEKRQALDAWSRKLAKIVSDKESTVTPIRRIENRHPRG